jgi:hypothetical protein
MAGKMQSDIGAWFFAVLGASDRIRQSCAPLLMWQRKR